MNKLKGDDGVAVNTHKMILLKDWYIIRESVKKGLKRLGHDIIIVPMYDTPDQEEKEGEYGN